MDRRILFFASLLLLAGVSELWADTKKEPVSYVNPMIGTSGMGHTFPGACAPFGIVQLSPETDTIPQNIDGRYVGKVYAYCAGYQHDDPTIVGFSHTHLSGTGHSDLGDIMIMPQTGALKLNPGTADKPENGYRSRFSHDTEIAEPGYYAVTLSDYNIKAEMTATQRVGVHRYTFPQGNDCRIILDMLHGIYNYDGKVLWSSLRVENDTLITGYRITNGWARCNYTYFAMSLSKPIKDYGYKDMKTPKYQGFWRKFNVNRNFPEIAGRDIVAYFNFDNSDSQPLVIKVALSAVGTDGALKNLRAEASGKSFDQIRTETEGLWNHELGLIECEGTDDQKAMQALETMYVSMQQRMQTEEQNVSNNLLEKILQTVKTFREAKGYKAVLRSEGVVDYDASLDVTPLVLDEVNKLKMEFKPVTSDQPTIDPAAAGVAPKAQEAAQTPAPKAAEAPAAEQSKPAGDVKAAVPAETSGKQTK